MVEDLSDTANTVTLVDNIVNGLDTLFLQVSNLGVRF